MLNPTNRTPLFGTSEKLSSKKMIPDREICTKWISRLCALETPNPTVKRNRNSFFKYLLTIINQGIEQQPEPHKGYPQYDDKVKNLEKTTYLKKNLKILFKFRPGDPTYGGKGYMSKWSNDRRTYVAAKPLPGRGALVYMAVAKDLSYGWENPQPK